MANIKLVIEIPEGLKNDFESEQWTALSCMEMKNALEKATPLPKGHGRLIDAREYENKIRKYYFDNSTVIRCTEITLDNTPPVIEADKAESEG